MSREILTSKLKKYFTGRLTSYPDADIIIVAETRPKYSPLFVISPLELAAYGGTYSCASGTTGVGSGSGWVGVCGTVAVARILGHLVHSSVHDSARHCRD
jgi:hypothetical protein